MRRCPRCTYPLELFVHEQQELDHCHRCGGTFLEPGEAHAIFGSHAEPSEWQKSFAANHLGGSELRCPKDAETLVAYEVEFKDKRVEVDVCNRCHGMWLDKAEGAVLYNVAAAAADHAHRRETGIEKPGIGTYVFQILTGFPIEAWNPVRRRPVVVYALLVLLVLLFVGQTAVQIAMPQWAADHRGFYMMVPLDVLNGHHLWTVVTCGFFHGGFMHILGNAYFLWIFGDNVEDKLGPKKFITLYAIALLAGSLLHFAFNVDSPIPMLGASGAIAGVMGAYLVLFPKVKLYVMIVVFRFRISVFVYLGFWILFQLVMATTGAGGTAWLAHAGGFFAGAILAFLFRRSIDHDTPVRV